MMFGGLFLACSADPKVGNTEAATPALNKDRN